MNPNTLTYLTFTGSPIVTSVPSMILLLLNISGPHHIITSHHLVVGESEQTLTRGVKAIQGRGCIKKQGVKTIKLCNSLNTFPPLPVKAVVVGELYYSYKQRGLYVLRVIHLVGLDKELPYV